MTTSRAAKPAAAAAVALALAVLAAVLAVDVLRWHDHLERADLRFAAQAGDRGMWTPDTILPAGLSRTLVGAEDDVVFRRAAQSFRLSRPRAPLRSQSDLARRSGAEAHLARAAREAETREQKAVLLNLGGVLALEEARSLELQAPVLLRRAAASFRQALRHDAAYDDAKFNLELALKLLRRGGSQSGGGGGDRTDTPASGAGSASSGRGY